MSDQKEQLLSAAFYYAELGYPVFPCVPNGKIPLTHHGFKDATTDSATIEDWWSRNPDANIGIPTEELLVVDVDGKNNQYLVDDPDKMSDLARGPLSLTPGGGRHHLFRQPQGKSWKNTSGKLADKVDTRANGGYIVVPPSVIEGKPYEWAEGYELNEPPDELPEPPDWLIEILDSGNGSVARTVAQGSPQGASSPPCGNIIPSGQRNATLARLAGTMRRVGMEHSEIKAALLQTNSSRCSPPLSMSEVNRIIASICRYEPDQISVAMVEDHWAQDSKASESNETEEIGKPLSDPGPLPEEILRVPGFVSEVMDYSLQTAPYPNTAMSFCGALALQAFLAGRKIRDPADNRTNIYLLGLAHSAAGKDWPRKVNTRILNEVGLVLSLGDRFASGEGIQDALFINPCMLFQTDEIDGMLQTINKARDARHENIMSTLLTMYSAANSIFPMRRKAGKEHPGSIDQPCLVVFGTAIPNHYYEALSERMLTNGFFARMIILESGRRVSGQEPVIREIPDRILAVTRWWTEFKPSSGNLNKLHPTPATVEHDGEAKRILAESREEADAEYANAEEKNDIAGTTVWGRVSEQIHKFALLYAISENHESPVISGTATEWASRFVMHQAKRMLFMAQNHVAENPFHADCLKLIQRLRDAPKQTLSHSILLKRMKMDTQTFQKIVATLSQQGDIAIIQNRTSGRTGILYRLRGK